MRWLRGLNASNGDTNSATTKLSVKYVAAMIVVCIVISCRDRAEQQTSGARNEHGSLHL
jgi:hypothetical protein